MLIPTNKYQTLLLWVAAFIVAIMLSFLTALSKQLSGTDPINWRPVFLDVIDTVITVIPIIAAGLGLPRLGKETLNNLVTQVGDKKAKEV